MLTIDPECISCKSHRIRWTLEGLESRCTNVKATVGVCIHGKKKWPHAYDAAVVRQCTVYERRGA